jgi:hypothetical protein
VLAVDAAVRATVISISGTVAWIGWTHVVEQVVGHGRVDGQHDSAPVPAARRRSACRRCCARLAELLP